MARKKPPTPTAENWPEGRTIVQARPMTKPELIAEGWRVDAVNGPPIVLLLNDGTKLYPSADPEGNHYGALFGIDPDGNTVGLT